MLEKYHLMPKQWDPTYPYDYLIIKLRRDLEDKEMLEGIAKAKAQEEQGQGQQTK